MTKNSLLVVGGVALFVLGSLDKLAFRHFLYWRYRWFDIPMHLLGGLAIGFLALYAFYGLENKVFGSLSVKKTLVLVLVVALAMGATWEFFEFRFDRTNGNSITVKSFRTLEKGKANSASDLVFDALGGLLAGSIFLFSRRRINNLKPNS